MIIENGPYTVYVLISKTTNKLYVGVTKQNPKNRFNNGLGYKHNDDFYKIIQEYGWNDIEQNIFAQNLTYEEAFNMEQYLIKTFRKQNANLVCNKDAGGEHGKHCNKTKEIIRKANIGRIISEEAKEKIRTARAKQVFSQEALDKRSAKMKGRKMTVEFCKALGERKSKAVKCIETNTIYKSATEASKLLNVSISGISQQCKNIIPHIKGLHFEYV